MPRSATGSARAQRPRLAASLWALALLCLALLHSPTAAAAPSPRGAAPLRVAVKQAPPFAERRPDGSWTGMSIELWREIATQLELDYTLHETTLDDMLVGVAEGRYAVAVAALTVTAEREQRVDFTHPFYTTGLAIGVSTEHRPHWRGVLDTVFSWTFLQLVLGLALLQLVVGGVVWMLERRANPEQFPLETVRGVATGFWWAAVTMTTVGYGDKAPKSLAGRAVALLWMLTSMVVIASVTATIASSMTIERLDARIRGPEDLHRFEVGAITGTTGSRYLDEHKIVSHAYATADAALAALEGREIDALVWDAPLLRATLDAHPELDIELVPGVFERQDYAIAVGPHSPLRESINRVLPDKVRALEL